MPTEAKTAHPYQWTAWGAMAGGFVLLIAGLPTLFDFVNKSHGVNSVDKAIMALVDATAGVGLTLTGALLIAGALVGLSLGLRR